MAEKIQEDDQHSAPHEDQQRRNPVQHIAGRQHESDRNQRGNAHDVSVLRLRKPQLLDREQQPDRQLHLRLKHRQFEPEIDVLLRRVIAELAAGAADHMPFGNHPVGRQIEQIPRPVIERERGDDRFVVPDSDLCRGHGFASRPP